MSEQRNTVLKRLPAKIFQYIRTPLWVLKKLIWKTFHTVNITLPLSAVESFERHNKQYNQKNSLQAEKAVYERYAKEDIFNRPGLEFGKLLKMYPKVRGTAIDIGSGCGWLSDTLTKYFSKVISIEPSAKAVSIAKKLCPKNKKNKIKWHIGFAQDELAKLTITRPALFVTGCVLSHLPDDVVMAICAIIDAKAPQGSILGFSECWGIEFHEPMWHVRTQQWWQKQLPHWRLDFNGPTIQHVPGRHMGFYGKKIK